MSFPIPALFAAVALLAQLGVSRAQTAEAPAQAPAEASAALAAATAAAPASWTDANARARLEAMESEGVLRDPFWAHAFWARSRGAPTDPARIADLRWAIRFDPELLEARRELCTLLVVRRDPAAVPEIVEALQHEALSFVGQRRAALTALTVVGGGFVLATALLALFAVVKTLPRLRHGLLERLRFLPAELRGPATILLLATPLAVALTLPPTSAAFWIVLLGSIAAWQFLDRWERRTCVTALVLLLTVPLGLLAWTRLAIPSLPTSYLNSLWEAQTSSDARPGFVVENLAPPGAAGDPDWHASLALADRRAGRFAEAAAHLERAIEIEPREWSYVNNLGNVKLLSGDADGAIAAYQQARTLGPREPLIRVNEAQAWVRKLEFSRADEALAEATRLGHRLPPLLGSDPGRVVVRDQVLDASALWRRLASGHGLDHALDVPRAASMIAGVVFPFRPIWLCLPLLLAAWWVSLARFLPRVAFCATCGTPVCRKCHYRVLRRSLCAECHGIRRDVTAPLKRQEELDNRRRRRQRLPRLLALLFAMLLPGSGFVLRGAARRAGFLLPAAVITILGAATATSVLEAVAPGTSGNAALPIALPIYGLLSLISLFGTWRMAEPRPADPMEAPALPGKDTDVVPR